jgi:hypothetical protein
MNAGTATFIVVMTLIIVIGSIINSAIRARYKNSSSGNAVADDRKVELLSAENAHLKGQVGRLEERLAVLERIATDPAERTAREIEQLRREAD